MNNTMKENLLRERDEITKKLQDTPELELQRPLWIDYYKVIRELNKLNPNWEKKICPRCGEIFGIPALSRKDNKTEVCELCGHEEATNEYLHDELLGRTLPD